MLMFVVTTVPAAALRTPREELEKNYEGVRFYDVGERVRRIYGVPMTRGKTADEAVDNWLTLYGEILSNSTEPGGPDLRRFSRFELKDGRTVYTFRQYMSDLHVEGSLVRVMTQELDGPRVTFVSSGVALRPKGGMPEPRINAKEALEAAEKHEAGKPIVRWREPSLVAIADWSKKGNGEAHPVWKIIGEHTADTRTFRVDAVTGVVLSWADDAAHAHATQGTDPVSGTISGKGSPGTEPDSIFGSCPNPADTMLLPYALVQAFDGSMNKLDAVYTDADGDYELQVPQSANVIVQASLIGPGWYVTTYDGAQYYIEEPCAETEDPLVATTSATAPSTGVDLLLNSSPSEYPTAQVNAHFHMAKTWGHFRDRFGWEPLVPGLDEPIEVAVNIKLGPTCGGRYLKNGGPCLGSYPMLLLQIVGTSPSDCSNTSYSTWISHEYGHYLLHHMLDIENSSSDPPRNGFHEGYSDTVAFLVQDTHIFGENMTGCNMHVRDPLAATSPPHAYPLCSSSSHFRGLLLGSIWLDLRNSESLTLAEVRQLHFEWSLIASAPEDEGPCATDMDQSADESTLIDVLIADDDDGCLQNGTPNLSVICDIFDSRGITSSVCTPTEPCPESRGGRACVVDCDLSTGVGVLDIFDFLCFQAAFTALDRWACNLDRSTGSNVCDVFDFLAFQVAFAGGCP